MARKKPVPMVMVTSLQEADKVLEELAGLERKASAIKNAMNEKIDTIKAEAAEEMIEVEARQKELEGALSSFALMNKESLFQKRKTVDLTFGTLSFRSSTRIVAYGKGSNQKTMLIKIKEMGFWDGLRMIEELNKEALQAWDDEKLAKIGAKKKTEDTFGYDIKQQQPGLTKAA